MSAYVIAEIGACHEGQLDRMRQAIDLAKQAGADAVKFQWTSDPLQMAKRRGRAVQDGYAVIYERYLHWPAHWHECLHAECAQRGLEYMCTVYLAEDVPVVATWVNRFKIASFEATDAAFVSAHAGFGKRVAMSTGMMNDHELRDALCRAPGELVIDLLHCVSAYPCPIESLSLGVIRTWVCEHEAGNDWLPQCFGLSDHSDPSMIWTGALAVAAGAEIVEAHMRLPSTSRSNPDYAHAMMPQQFSEYVRHIRFAETCLGDGEKRVQSCEERMAAYKVGAVT